MAIENTTPFLSAMDGPLDELSEEMAEAIEALNVFGIVAALMRSVADEDDFEAVFEKQQQAILDILEDVENNPAYYLKRDSATLTVTAAAGTAYPSVTLFIMHIPDGYSLVWLTRGVVGDYAESYRVLFHKEAYGAGWPMITVSGFSKKAFGEDDVIIHKFYRAWKG